MTTLVEQLFDRYGVAAVGFDVVFAEPDTSSGLDSLTRLAERELAGSREFRRSLEELAPRLDYDARFARALAERPVSLGYYFIPEGYGDARTGMLPPPSLQASVFAPLQLGTPAVGYGANLAQFQHVAQGAGFFNMRADDDGTARRMNMVSPFGEGYYLALSASTLRVAFGGEPVAAGADRQAVLGRQYALPWIEVGGRFVQDHYRGMLGEGRGNADLLAFAATHGREGLVGKVPGAGQLHGALHGSLCGWLGLISVGKTAHGNELGRGE